MTENVVAICTPTLGSVSAEYAFALAGLCVATPNTKFVLLRDDARPVSEGRNNCIRGIEHIEAGDAMNGRRMNYVFFLDGDVVPPPNVLSRLLAADKDIVGGAYIRRGPPYDLMVWGLDGKPFRSAKTGVHEIGSIPTGCMLIRRSIFDAFKQPIFRYVVNEERGSILGEDIVFCVQARERGFKVFVDMDLSNELSHIATQILQNKEENEEFENKALGILRQTLSPVPLLPRVNGVESV